VLKSCFYDDRNTELAQAVDVMMAQAKIIYVLMIIVFSLRNSLNEIENIAFRVSIEF